MEKVTDPRKIVTDPYVASQLNKQGIDKDYVEFWHDYGALGKLSSPYAKFYRDLKSNKIIAVASLRPRTNNDGVWIVPKWRCDGDRFYSDVNMFSAIVNGTEFRIRGGQKDITANPQVFLNSVESLPVDIFPILRSTLREDDTLEWDYGIFKRTLRLGYGAIYGEWSFTGNPHSDAQIRYNQKGSKRLSLGRYQINPDEELIPKAIFDEAEYPFVVGDTDTSFSTADTHIILHAPDINEGGEASLGIGNAATAVDAAYRALLKYDFSGIDSSAIVLAVTLSLWEWLAFDTAGVGSWAVEINRLLRNWVELEATWNIYRTAEVWATAGGQGAADWDSDISATKTLDGTAAVDYLDWSGATLLEDVQKIIDGTYANNYGWMLHAPTAELTGAGVNSGNLFRTREQGGTSNDPKLVVVFSLGWSGGDVLGITIADVAKINGVALADITKVNGVA